MNHMTTFILLAVLAQALGAAGPAPGLVPATADEDPRLPSVRIMDPKGPVRIHVREFGRPDAPVLMVLPGSLSDVRAYLPFRAFADTWRVVIWDLPGSGLSQRLDADRLGFDDMVEAIHAMKEHYSPGAPIVLAGHSWSAFIAAKHAATYPGDSRALVLIESPGFSSDFQNTVGGALNLGSVGYTDMNWFQGAMSPGSHERLDFQMLAMLRSGVRDFFVDRSKRPPWPVWRVGGLALMVWERSVMGADGRFDYDHTGGMDKYTQPVLVVGSSHSPIGHDFQAATNATVFPDSRMLYIPESGHRMLTENWQALEAGLRDFLAPLTQEKTHE